jgi:glycine/D-amino acid oxidase-like deaminating enzyme
MQSLIPFRPRYDAVIVGARCAGAATALLLARAGSNVLLVDRQAYGSDTMSTHALSARAFFSFTAGVCFPW